MLMSEIRKRKKKKEEMSVSFQSYPSYLLLNTITLLTGKLCYQNCDLVTKNPG